MVKFESKIW